MTQRRVTIVTAGHLATCPRMVKAADALHAAGYRVRVISTSQTPWAMAADRTVVERRSWIWEPIEHARTTAPLRWLSSGVRQRVAEAVARGMAGAAPHGVSVAAFSRMHPELVHAIMREPSDLIYGGTSGALAAVAEAGRLSGTPFALDLEDFHCAEHGATSRGLLRDGLAALVMSDAVRDARFVTVGSTAIGRACQERFGIGPLTINNVFPLPAAPIDDGEERDLRLYWFSQTIGPGRGLEDVVRAVGVARINAELHLRGVPAANYALTLQQLIDANAPELRLVLHAPDDPDRLVAGCTGYDVGLAVERDVPVNRALSLTNKALTYPLAGLAMVLTDTAGQHPLVADLGEDAIVYTPGDVAWLAEGLARWSGDRRALRRAKEAAWDAARRRWHWEHALERDQLLAAVEAAA